MKNLKYNSVTSDKVAVNGIVTVDGLSIDYVNDDGEHELFDIEKWMKLFGGQKVTFSVATKKDDDLTQKTIKEVDED